MDLSALRQQILLSNKTASEKAETFLLKSQVNDLSKDEWRMFIAGIPEDVEKGIGRLKSAGPAADGSVVLSQELLASDRIRNGGLLDATGKNEEVTGNLVRFHLLLANGSVADCQEVYNLQFEHHRAAFLLAVVHLQHLVQALLAAYAVANQCSAMFNCGRCLQGHSGLLAKVGSNPALEGPSGAASLDP
ncbi:hypothetical protein WJX77_002691 [Trebouxia sp. C0004]